MTPETQTRLTLTDDLRVTRMFAKSVTLREYASEQKQLRKVRSETTRLREWGLKNPVRE